MAAAGARRGSLASAPESPLTRSSSQDSQASGAGMLVRDSDDDDGGGADAPAGDGPRRGSWAAYGPETATEVAARAQPVDWKSTGIKEVELRRREGSGVAVTVDNRLIAVFEHRGAIYAVDGMCYHAGGPLAQATLIDIEELDNRPCVVCPWHRYMIMLDSGEGIYRHVEPGTANTAAIAAAALAASPHNGASAGAAVAGTAFKSKGRKQRVHPVRVHDGVIEVALSSVLGPLHDATPYPSDYYASDAYRQIMNRASRAKAPVSAAIVAASLDSL